MLITSAVFIATRQLLLLDPVFLVHVLAIVLPRVLPPGLPLGLPHGDAELLSTVSPFRQCSGTGRATVTATITVVIPMLLAEIIVRVPQLWKQ